MLSEQAKDKIREAVEGFIEAGCFRYMVMAGPRRLLEKIDMHPGVTDEARADVKSISENREEAERYLADLLGMM